MYSPRLAHSTTFTAHWENLIEEDEFKVGFVDVTQPHKGTSPFCSFPGLALARARDLSGDGALLCCTGGQEKTASISKTILQHDRTAPNVVSF